MKKLLPFICLLASCTVAQDDGGAGNAGNAQQTGDSGASAVNPSPAAQTDASTWEAETPLGLPPLQIPEDNPMSAEKVALGGKLFDDVRFSSTGTVSCATCHVRNSGFTDSPLRVSVGIDELTGTRNAPTVINAAYNRSQFWDGRSPDLEDQAQHPFINPVEMGLESHDPILEIIRSDEEYVSAFQEVFDVSGPDEISFDMVQKAIAAFERTQIAGNSPFDRWYFGGEEDAVDESVKRGFQVFLAEGRCVSCHMIEQDNALFTDHRFHNIGVGINRIEDRVPELAPAFLEADLDLEEVDVEVLSDPDTSELGRFAVTGDVSDVGAFKTATLRNIALTPPYMHDGSIATLREVVEHYNNGGFLPPLERANPYLSGGIRPLNLTEQQIDDLVSFMEALTSPEYVMEEGSDNER